MLLTSVLLIAAATVSGFLGYAAPVFGNADAFQLAAIGFGIVGGGLLFIWGGMKALGGKKAP